LFLGDAPGVSRILTDSAPIIPRVLTDCLFANRTGNRTRILLNITRQQKLEDNVMIFVEGNRCRWPLSFVVSQNVLTVSNTNQHIITLLYKLKIIRRKKTKEKYLQQKFNPTIPKTIDTRILITMTI